MLTVIIVLAAVVLGAVVVIALMNRRPRSDDGVASFQRHLGALSPEARRSSIERGSATDPKGDS